MFLPEERFGLLNSKSQSTANREKFATNHSLMTGSEAVASPDELADLDRRGIEPLTPALQTGAPPKPAE
jgi:hypothetical protein